VDREDWSGAQIGGRLADMARTTVIWPSAAELPAGYVQTYFRDMPPLRFDRDTVLLGKLDPAAAAAVDAAGIEVQGEMDGKPVRLQWRVKPSPSDPDNAYLAELAEMAERDGGLSLPTVGAAGLADLRGLVRGEAAKLAQLGQQALVLGQFDQAERLAAEANRLDPLNAQAETVRTAANKSRRRWSAVPQALPGDRGPLAAIRRRAGGSSAAESSAEDADGELLDQVERQQRVYVQFLRSEVRNAVNQTRAMMGVDPENAANMLKLTLEKVAQAPELDPEVRSQLRDQIEAALQAASQQAIVKAERDLRREEIAAEAQARRQINRDLFL